MALADCLLGPKLKRCSARSFLHGSPGALQWRLTSDDYMSVNLRALCGPFPLLRLIWGNGSKLAAKLERSCFHTEGPSESLSLSLPHSLIPPIITRPIISPVFHRTLGIQYHSRWLLLPWIPKQISKNSNVDCAFELNDNGYFIIKSDGTIWDVKFCI